MATPKLSITIRNADIVLNALQRYKKESESLEVKYQYFIAEMIMLRLFSTFEDAVSGMAHKIASGATYINGVNPKLITQANNIAGSRSLFMMHGRVRPVQYLKWTKAKYIKDSVKHVIPVTESFIINAQMHGPLIEEMRKVRNVIAHNTSTAKSDFKFVIRQVYGANAKITTGTFLTTTRRAPCCNLDRYISATRIIISDMARGY